MKCVFMGVVRKSGEFEKDGKAIVYDNYNITLCSSMRDDTGIGYEAFTAKIPAKSLNYVLKGLNPSEYHEEELWKSFIREDCEVEFDRYGKIRSIDFNI